eukprot:gene8074-1316_t
MAISTALRGLASLSRQAIPVASVCARELQTKGFATDALSRKDVAYMLDNRDDPEVDAAIKDYMKSVYSGSAPAEAPEETLELASKIERKYVAAQIVDYGMLNISVPLGATGAPVKRYAEELMKLGSKAGFECPATEVAKHITEKTLTAETAKEMLVRIKPFTSAEFNAALTDALLAVEAESGGSVMLDGSSDGYKKFAEKVKVIATAQGIPWKLLVAAKSGGDDTVKKDYAAWLQSARVADATAELSVFAAEATTKLDKHLTKTVEQVRTEQAASMALLKKKIASAKGAKWATAFAADLEAVEAYDRAMASGASA